MRGAAAPEGPMTYDSMLDNYLILGPISLILGQSCLI